MKGLLAVLALACMAMAGCTGSTAGSDKTDGDTQEGGHADGAGDEARQPLMEDGKYVVKLVSGSRFDPKELTVPAGSTVVWVVENGIHDVTEGAVGAEDHAWSSEDDGGKLTPGDRYEQTFDEAGVVQYRCEMHESSGMTGTITVE